MNASNECPGRFKCHGPVNWCNVCGDVSFICDDPHCEAHLRGTELYEIEVEARMALAKAESDYKYALKRYEEAERTLRSYLTANVAMVERKPKPVSPTSTRGVCDELGQK